MKFTKKSEALNHYAKLIEETDVYLQLTPSLKVAINSAIKQTAEKIGSELFVDAICNRIEKQSDKKHLSWKAPVKKCIMSDGTALEVGDKILSNHSGKIYEIFNIDYTNSIVYATGSIAIVFDDIKKFEKVRIIIIFDDIKNFKKVRVDNINGIDYTLPVCNSFSELLELDKDLFKTIGKEFFK